MRPHNEGEVKNAHDDCHDEQSSAGGSGGCRFNCVHAVGMEGHLGTASLLVRMLSMVGRYVGRYGQHGLTAHMAQAAACGSKTSTTHVKSMPTASNFPLPKSMKAEVASCERAGMVSGCRDGIH